VANDETVGVLRVLLEANAAQFEATLKSAEGTTNSVSKSLTKLTNSFSGQHLAVEAAKVAEAVTRVGGATRLTEQELNKVRHTIEQTAAKFRLMGAELPASIAKVRSEIQALDAAAAQQKSINQLRDQIKGVDVAATTAASGGVSKLSTSLSMVGRFLPILSAAGAIAGLTRLASQSVETAGRITDLAQKTGLSTKAIQQMEAVADQTGTSVEAFANATFKLGVNVADGSKKARDAVAELGLQYESLKNQRPEDQFNSVVKALENVDNQQERNRLGVALFGKQFSEIAASIEDGYSGIADSASVASDAQIRALDKAGDAWAKFKTDVSATATSALGTIALYAQDTAAAIRVALDWSKYTDAQKSRISDVIGAGGEGLAAMLEDISKARTTDIELTAKGAKSSKDYAAALAETRKEVASLSVAQRTQLNAALQLGGEAAQEYADSINLSDAALRMYQGQLRGASSATKTFAKDTDTAAAAAEKFRGSVTNLTSLWQPYAAGVDDVGESLHDLASGSLHETAVATEKARLATEQWIAENGKLAPSIQAVGSAIDETSEKTVKFGATISSAFEKLPQVIMGAIQGGGKLGESIGAMFGAEIFGKDSALVKSLTGGLTNILGKTIGGAIGAMLPGLGTLLGAGIGKLTDKLFGKLFGGEGKKVNDLRDAFTSAAGGIDKLAERAAKAGLTLERFYKAKSVKEYEAAIAELDAAFTRLDENREKAGGLFDEIMEAGRSGIPAAFRPAIEQLIELGLLTDEQSAKLREMGDGSVVDVDKMTSAIEMFKGRVESLGPAFRQAQIDKTAKQYVNAIDTLIKGGADVGGVLFDAKEELSDLVNQSIKSGTVLPANMKPWVDELARAGLLLDENGQKIEDTSDLKYGEAMKTEAEIAEEGWKNILEAIKELVAEIRGPLNSAIDDVTGRRRTIHIDYETGEVPPGPEPDPGFAVGTAGRFGKFFANFPKSGFPTKLHGTEAVITPDQAVPFAASVMSGAMPGLPSLASGSLSSAPPAMAMSGDTTHTSTAQTNNAAVVVVQQGGSGLDLYAIKREVFKAFKGAVAMDIEGMGTTIDLAIENYNRTYSNG
jgi:hypothetical protein